jgi:hypothetical protein
MMRIAYARSVIPTEPIRPLQDVWLRPRRVFRQLASQPIGLADHWLGAAQGMISMLGYSRAKDFGAKLDLGQIFFTAAVTGAVIGIVSLHIMAAIYARLGSRVGRLTTRRPIVHVLAYGGLPMAAALGIWVLTALIAGEATFVQAPKDVDDFINLLLGTQFLSYVLLLMWSVVLQVMGFSEILAVSNGKAFGVWVLGQVIAVLAILFVYLLAAALVGSP